MTYNFYALKKVLIIVLEFDFEGKHLYFSSVDIRSFFMKNTSFVVQKYYFSDKKKERLFLQTLKKNPRHLYTRKSKTSQCLCTFELNIQIYY